ncbi:phage holin family protein [uncultured Roseobacter sp.]|uniref:phage holin family protein n=1 Tax=uncultured Roseobacter sp. TaxID=114847 RepID=UPI002614CCCA|nr:phage holin family protein [uncultured Roseobacter sp.]
MNADPNRSASGLMNDAMTQMSGLVRKEVDLARAEVTENLKSAAAAIGMIVGAAILALTSLNVLSAALVAALTDAGIAVGWSALIVGVAFGALAWAMLAKGTHDLKLSSLMPSRTVKNVRRDTETVKESLDA